MASSSRPSERRKITIIGGGFGGVAVARGLARAPGCDVHLIDRRNFHLFQPLLYQVAMAGLNPSDVAIPLRRLFSKQRNLRVTLAEIDDLDLPGKRIRFDERWHPFDDLVIATGAKHSYFGNDAWEPVAPGLKTIEQATEIRRRVLLAFELAEKEEDLSRRAALLTFVVVGGGPTGVELAGAIAEMASRTLYHDYRVADLSHTEVLLVELGDRVLPSFPPALSQATAAALTHLGVTIATGVRASALGPDGLRVGDRFVPCHTILWAAGVTPSRLAERIPAPKGAQGRILVAPDLSVPGHPDVFVIGDLAAVRGASGATLPGIAPVAMQEGRFVARLLLARARGDLRDDPPIFRYRDRGMLATIGRSKAVANLGRLQLSGLLAWLLWVFVHIVFLMCFRNRFFVFLQWIWSYFRFGRGARLIVYKTWRTHGEERPPFDAA